MLEPYRPIFIGVVLVVLFFAWRRIWRPALTCAPGEVCAVPQIKRAYKHLFHLFAVLPVPVLIVLTFRYIVPWFY